MYSSKKFNPSLNRRMPGAASEEAETIKKKRRRILDTLLMPERSDDESELAGIAEMMDNKRNKPATNSDLQTLAESIRQTLLEITEIKERNLERRHQEILQLLERCLGNGSTRNIELVEATAVDTMEDRDKEEVSSVGSTALALVEESAIKKEECNLESFDEKNSKTVKTMGLEEVRIKLLPKSCILRTDEQCQSHNEFRSMCENMLEIQRKKMEDRERKQRRLLQFVK